MPKLRGIFAKTVEYVQESDVLICPKPKDLLQRLVDIAIVECAIRNRINHAADIDSGVFMCLGADYHDVGVKTAEYMVRVIKGENPASIPFLSYVPEQVTLSLPLAKEYGIKLPDDVVKKAARVVK